MNKKFVLLEGSAGDPSTTLVNVDHIVRCFMLYETAIVQMSDGEKKSTRYKSLQELGAVLLNPSY